MFVINLKCFLVLYSCKYTCRLRLHYWAKATN
jgi:hypothetical protein